MTSIETFTGRIEAAELGATPVHEHLRTTTRCTRIGPCSGSS
jgi:predicted metal-dependent phosphotriesterase family hydrolase